MKKYTKTHEWVEESEDGVITIGLSDYAQNELGDIVFINLPELGKELKVDDVFADVESVKAVSEVYSPVNGIILEVNEELLDTPEKINYDPLNTWLIRVTDVSEFTELMDEESYLEFVS